MEFESADFFLAFQKKIAYIEPLNLEGVAQLDRAPGCGPGGRGFESRHSP